MCDVGYALNPLIAILCLIRSLLFKTQMCSRPSNCCLIVDVALGRKSLEAPVFPKAIKQMMFLRVLLAMISQSVG